MQQTATSSDSGAPRRTVRDTLRRAAGRLRRGRADERGLTTLEWLLIVAAVAGLAALAVVLVQNVVDETAEDIGGQSARGTAARVAAERITREARAELPTYTEYQAVDTKTEVDSLNSANAGSGTSAVNAVISKQNDVNSQYGAACDRLEITYGDIEVTSKWEPAKVANASTHLTSSGTMSDRDQGETSPETGEDFMEARCEATVPS